MSDAMPGRNEPCHCGSGKKYKKCHWAQDRAAAAERAEVERARQARLDAMGSPSEEEMRQLYQEMTGQRMPKDFIPDELRETLGAIWQRRKLADQARAALDEGRAERAAAFEADPESFDAMARGLAGELDLNDYLLTKTNVRKIKKALGELPEGAAERRAFVAEAARLTLDEEDMESFHHGLLGHLPDLVEAGRLEEAQVLEACADQLLEDEPVANAFLEDVVARSL